MEEPSHSRLLSCRGTRHLRDVFDRSSTNYINCPYKKSLRFLLRRNDKSHCGLKFPCNFRIACEDSITIRFFFRWPTATNSIIQKSPVRILCFNECFFLRPAPPFQFFLSCYCIVDVLKFFIINQIIAIEFTCKGFMYSFVEIMFGYSQFKIVGHTNIEYCSFRICDDIKKIKMLFINVHSGL